MKLIPILLAATLLSGCIVINADDDDLDLVGSQNITQSNFDGLELRGGGDVHIQHGRTFSVNREAEAEGWIVGLDGDTLVLECDRQCRDKNADTIVVTLPSIDNIAITGGGDMMIDGDFPNTNELNIALVGGGDIDARSVQANEVNISIVGGGEIDVAAATELNVSIIGGGEIGYVGSPEVNRSVIGGGQVRQIR